MTAPVTGFPSRSLSLKLLAPPMQRVAVSVPDTIGRSCADEVPANTRELPLSLQSGFSVGSVMLSLSTMVISAVQVEPGVHETPLTPRSSTNTTSGPLPDTRSMLSRNVSSPSSSPSSRMGCVRVFVAMYQSWCSTYSKSPGSKKKLRVPAV